MAVWPTSPVEKDPDDVLDYKADWSDWLPSGDTISSASFTLDSGITEDSSSNTTTDATVWISGGTVGEHYTVTSRITTAQGRTADRSFILKIVEK